jgi:putative DNA-invertase from lambdoid prophage Rac
MFRVGLYARVSTHDQQTLPLQMRAMREYAAKRGWTIAVQIKEVGSGAVERELRENLLAAARRREIDVVLVWRLDRWGRSLADLVVTLKELAELGVGFVSLTEALDLTTPTGRAMAGLLSVFAEFEHEILRERIRAGIAEARLKGKHLGRPVTAEKGQPDPEAPPCRRQQSRDRPPPRHRPHLRAPNPAPRGMPPRLMQLHA